MDLSKLSTEDLQALKVGDLSKVSTPGLQFLKTQVNLNNANQQPFAKANQIEAKQDDQQAGQKSMLRRLADTATAAVGGVASTIGTPKYPGMQEAMQEHPDAASVGHAAGTVAEMYAAPKIASAVGRPVLGGILRGTSAVYKGAKSIFNGGLSGMLDRAANYIDPKDAEAAMQQAPNASIAAEAAQSASSSPASVLSQVLTGKAKIDPFTKKPIQ